FWDGHTTSGEKVSDGTYFYTIKYINGDGNSVEKKGCVSLFR
ncbi:MAG: gliding motility-associated C-terminal domain-containing protein, partial [Bacteroidetes bacterium]|nr:gliding motility-associated C-terminal domain-containing protein [Bacteroidota bacterium]